nr:MAG: hypothetical protein [Bacteriophage sp.]
MNNQLFNQLLNRGYRITFTSSQVMYTTPEGVSKTLQYAGDPDAAVQSIYAEVLGGIDCNLMAGSKVDDVTALIDMINVLDSGGTMATQDFIIFGIPWTIYQGTTAYIVQPKGRFKHEHKSFIAALYGHLVHELNQSRVLFDDIHHQITITKKRGSNEIPDEATLGLWNQIVGNFKNPWAPVLQLTCPLDGGLVKVGPIQPLSQIKDLSIVFENVSNVRNHGDALIQQLQLNGIQTAWVLHAQYPTLLAMSSGFCPTGNSSGMPFGVY